MALKDAIDKIVSYFDTDEVTDYEDAAKEEAKERPVKARPVKAQRPVQTPPPRQQRQPERSQATVPPRRQHVNSDLQETQVLRSLPLSRSQAIKYPKKYEDAQEIVELLIENECVLIDFQYMLEAQARRCLDFIDGASKVLTGNLQKVGSSMYLLTPINVVVDIEEIGLSHGNQEANFDFDMKRR